MDLTAELATLNLDPAQQASVVAAWQQAAHSRHETAQELAAKNHLPADL